MDNLSEKYICSQLNGSFTQSCYWEKIKSGWIHERIILKKANGEIYADMLILIKKIPFLNCSFMYSPRGPVCDFSNESVLTELKDEIFAIQKKYNGFMLKIDPLIEDSDAVSVNLLTDLGFVYSKEKKGYDTVQCKENYMLNIKGKTEEEVFNSFTSKCRYNVRLAKRKGVRCNYYGIEKIDDFYTLLQETSQRDNFNIRTKRYYINFITDLEEHCRLYMCYVDGMPVSGAIAVNYAGKVHYVYGASSSKLRNYMPNYLMQWEMIKWAIETDCYVYDFQGIPYYYDENHPNYGVYKFKKGFNGHIVNFAGEFDYIFNPITKTFVNVFLKISGRKLL